MEINIALYYDDLITYLSKAKRLEKITGVFVQKPEFEALPYLCLGKIHCDIQEAVGGNIYQCRQELNLYADPSSKNGEMLTNINNLLETFLSSNFELLSFRLAELNYLPVYDGKIWQQQLNYQFSFYK